jgi:Cytochrome P460
MAASSARPDAQSGRAAAAAAPLAVDDGPQYSNGTNLTRPANYREWVFLSSSLDLNYPPPGAPPGPQRFDNVFVNPSSYRLFMQTGKWPDKTIFVLEFREAAKEASPDRPGKFQTAMAGIEAEVKDSRFPDGWAFFAFGPPGPANAGVAPLSGDTVARCIDCHTKHTAVERTFVQFYPTLFEAAKGHGTIKTNYTDP